MPTEPMHRHWFLAIGVAVALTGLHILLIEPVDRDMHAGHHGSTVHSQNQSAFVQDMGRDMDKMMRDMHAPGYTGRPDVDFLAMMIPHHQGAIDMARAVLRHGDDPLTRQLAEEIIASQQAEIAAMTARLAILRHGPDPSPGGFPSLGGTRGR
ncbi:MAG: DUF305 domain-containing protein [Ferrovibrio sp.]